MADKPKGPPSAAELAEQLGKLKKGTETKAADQPGKPATPAEAAAMMAKKGKFQSIQQAEEEANRRQAEAEARAKSVPPPPPQQPTQQKSAGQAEASAASGIGLGPLAEEVAKRARERQVRVEEQQKKDATQQASVADEPDELDQLLHDFQQDQGGAPAGGTAETDPDAQGTDDAEEEVDWDAIEAEAAGSDDDLPPSYEEVMTTPEEYAVEQPPNYEAAQDPMYDMPVPPAEPEPSGVSALRARFEQAAQQDAAEPQQSQPKDLKGIEKGAVAARAEGFGGQAEGVKRAVEARVAAEQAVEQAASPVEPAPEAVQPPSPTTTEAPHADEADHLGALDMLDDLQNELAAENAQSADVDAGPVKSESVSPDPGQDEFSAVDDLDDLLGELKEEQAAQAEPVDAPVQSTHETRMAELQQRLKDAQERGRTAAEKHEEVKEKWTSPTGTTQNQASVEPAKLSGAERIAQMKAARAAKEARQQTRLQAATESQPTPPGSHSLADTSKESGPVQGGGRRATEIGGHRKASASAPVTPAVENADQSGLKRTDSAPAALEGGAARAAAATTSPRLERTASEMTGQRSSKGNIFKTSLSTIARYIPKPPFGSRSRSSSLSELRDSLKQTTEVAPLPADTVKTTPDQDKNALKEMIDRFNEITGDVSKLNAGSVQESRDDLASQEHKLIEQVQQLQELQKKVDEYGPQSSQPNQFKALSEGISERMEQIDNQLNQGALRVHRDLNSFDQVLQRMDAGNYSPELHQQNVDQLASQLQSIQSIFSTAGTNQEKQDAVELGKRVETLGAKVAELGAQLQHGAGPAP